MATPTANKALDVYDRLARLKGIAADLIVQQWCPVIASVVRNRIDRLTANSVNCGLARCDGPFERTLDLSQPFTRGDRDQAEFSVNFAILCSFIHYPYPASRSGLAGPGAGSGAAIWCSRRFEKQTSSARPSCGTRRISSTRQAPTTIRQSTISQSTASQPRQMRSAGLRYVLLVHPARAPEILELHLQRCLMREGMGERRDQGAVAQIAEGRGENGLATRLPHKTLSASRDG